MSSIFILYSQKQVCPQKYHTHEHVHEYLLEKSRSKGGLLIMQHVFSQGHISTEVTCTYVHTQYYHLLFDLFWNVDLVQKQHRTEFLKPVDVCQLATKLIAGKGSIGKACTQ